MNFLTDRLIDFYFYLIFLPPHQEVNEIMYVMFRALKTNILIIQQGHLSFTSTELGWKQKSQTQISQNIDD